jgi:hypothetical protein
MASSTLFSQNVAILGRFFLKKNPLDSSQPLFFPPSGEKSPQK